MEKHLQKVKTETLRHLVYKELRHALLVGSFQPGETVTVRELANSLGLGLTPVREGVQLLASQGGLDLLPNRSVQVPLLTDNDLQKLFECRILVEAYATAQAVPNLSASDINKLGNLLDDLERSVDERTPHAGLEANFAFHFLIYEAAGSRYLLEIVERLWLRVGPLLTAPYRAPAAEQAEYWATAADHRKLIIAIESRDAQAAADCIRRVLAQSLNWLLTSRKRARD